jgi:hypothetical protein
MRRTYLMARERNDDTTLFRWYAALVEWQTTHGIFPGLRMSPWTHDQRTPTEDELFEVLRHHPWGSSREGDRLAEKLCEAIDRRIPSLLLLGGSCQ